MTKIKDITTKEDILNFEEKLSTFKSDVNKRLDEIVNEKCPPYFRREVKYALKGGHKWRPILLLSIAEMLGNEPKQVMDAACAMEFIQSASIILDDSPSMDRAKLRRGLPAFYIKFGVAQAEITSHVMSVLAYSLFLRYPKQTNRILPIVFDTILNLSAAQSMDVKFTGREINYSKLLNIYKGKSGYLYTCVAKVAAILSNTNNLQMTKLSNFGQHLGIAYQLMDDVADVTGDSKTIGKNIGMDRNKFTSVKALGIAGVEQKIKFHKNQALGFINNYKKKDFVIYLIDRIISG